MRMYPQSPENTGRATVAVRFLAQVSLLILLLCGNMSTTVAQQALVVRPLAERKVTELPAGELHWWIENYPTRPAGQYLLRINEVSGPPGSITAIHSHPGSEAYFVLAGEQSIRGSDGVTIVKAGEPQAGHGADMGMQVSSSGSTDLQALVMFVVDANRPFSSPASLP